MNSHHNLPIILQYDDDGTVYAHCPLLSGCECKSATRALALRTMAQIIKQACATDIDRTKGRKYEVVHLAIAPTVSRPLRHGSHGGARMV